MPSRRHARTLTRGQRRLDQALRPFLARHDSPVELRAWPGRTKTAIVCTKESLVRQWDHEGWIPRGVLLVTFRSIQPAGGLQPALAALGALTKKAVFIGDLDPVDLTSFMTLESAAPPGLRVVYGGMDDEWLVRERASRTTADATPYIKMPKTEQRLWRALIDVHPDLERIIGPNSRQLLDRGLKVEIEGACNLRWHGRSMCRFALRRALASVRASQ
jgi:hypothetical protein